MKSTTAAEPYTDRTPMPFGTHIGKPLVNVPAQYLLYLLNKGLNHPQLRRYISENMDALQSEVQKCNR